MSKRIDLTYPSETLKVKVTSYPNGYKHIYETGRPQYHLLPSNHPDVLAEKQRREVKNSFRASKLKIA